MALISRVFWLNIDRVYSFCSCPDTAGSYSQDFTSTDHLMPVRIRNKNSFYCFSWKGSSGALLGVPEKRKNGHMLGSQKAANFSSLPSTQLQKERQFMGKICLPSFYFLPKSFWFGFLIS